MIKNQLKVDIHQGLTFQEVSERKHHGYDNRPVDSASKSVKDIIQSNVFTYFNLIFLMITILLIIVRSYQSLTFLPVIITNTLVGIIQEIRSKKTLDQLSVLNEPKAHVIRQGQNMTVDVKETVLDDLVVLNAGNQIFADALVVDGSIYVNESLITGESDEIEKHIGDTLLSGSFVVAGTCKAQLVRVGKEAYISKLTLEAKAMKSGESSKMIQALNRIVKAVGVIIIPVGIIMFSQQYFLQKISLQESVVSTIAAIIGMIPEGLYLLASVALVVSVLRLAKQKVLVHDMKCIETLARVDTLCVDKTGTITENKMRVEDIIYLTEKHEYVLKTLGNFIGNIENDNETMVALRQKYTLSSFEKGKKVFPFSSKTKLSAVCFEKKSYVLGAPEFVLKEKYIQYQSMIAPYHQKGYRVVVFGESDECEFKDGLKYPIDPLCFILLINPIRDGAKETFTYFKEQGVTIKVISGDHPQTVSYIASKAGIENSERWIDASSLHQEEQIREALKYYTVFGRVTPEQKRQFVKILKQLGHTVAMTGDGVNDVLALKDADCSIAMASGSEAASQVAMLVLMDNDFSCMPSVVLEGRRVVNNIERSASLFLVKNIFSLLMSLFVMISVLPYPLYPTQVSLVASFTIGIPAFILALEPNKQRIQGDFLVNVLKKALPAGITDFLMIAIFLIFSKIIHLPMTSITTISTMILASVGMMVLIKVSWPFNHIRAWTLGLMMVGMVSCIIFLNELFMMSSLKVIELIYAFIFCSTSWIVYQVMIYLENKLDIERRLKEK